MDANALVDKLLAKMDSMIASLADVQARLLGLEKQMSEHTRPCQWFTAHVAAHEANQSFWRSIASYLIGGLVLAGLLAICAAAAYAVHVGWLSSPK